LIDIQEGAMPKVVDYYFTPPSPWTYLGHDRFVAMASRHGASINVKPVDFGKVFAVSGGLPLKQRAPQRQAYRLVELERWPKFLGIPLNKQPKFFPVSGDAAAKWILAASTLGTTGALKLTGAILRAVWVEDRNIADASVLATIAQEQSLDAKGLAAGAESPDTASRYEALTQEAIERQVFGAPTYLYRDEPFWGQDRLDFLDREMAK
jgi:2-hydroxychromene-2-carboxylate isomerase